MKQNQESLTEGKNMRLEFKFENWKYSSNWGKLRREWNLNIKTNVEVQAWNTKEVNYTTNVNATKQETEKSRTSGKL